MTEAALVARARFMDEALKHHHRSDPQNARLTAEAQLISAIAYLERVVGPLEALRMFDTLTDYLIGEAYRNSTTAKGA